MFIDKKNNEEKLRRQEKNYAAQKPRTAVSRTVYYVIFSLAAMAFMVAVLIMIKEQFGFDFLQLFKFPPPGTANKTATSTYPVLSGKLPPELGGNNVGNGRFGSSTTGIKAEDLTFGSFYKKTEDTFISTVRSYSLPINIKTDAANYYEISRKINLDDYLDKINSDGFAIIPNPFHASADDFFSLYNLLASKEIPLIITDDFLFYYNGNILKRVFKEIEKNAFYDNVWDIMNELYAISLSRYKRRLKAVGLANDPVLEAERMETAYFAVAIKLLMPNDRQINSSRGTGGYKSGGFSSLDQEKYYFELPDFFQDDVDTEVRMIKASMAANKKSPVLLYRRDYRQFRVPENYGSNARLNNFYLATRWLNSLFPLYYIGRDCPDCLLDKDDWLINMAAASFITKDIYDNQDLKNQWAIVYKFISFFSGLRKDLTYLHYYRIYTDIFGEKFNPEDIFTSRNKNRDADLAKIQAGIASRNFLGIEGGLDRSKKSNRPHIGMRILQSPYWPNDYIFGHLTGVDIKGRWDFSGGPVFTACQPLGKNFYFRCRGFGLDIINLLSPSVLQNNSYWDANINYDGYDKRARELKSQLGRFNVYAWNENIYWMTLDIAKQLLVYDTSGLPIFARSADWLRQREVNTALGAWVDLHLPADELVYLEEKSGSGLSNIAGCNIYNYVEPNYRLIGELAAKNNMIGRMLSALKVAQKDNVTSLDLKKLNDKLDKFLKISQKELTDRVINEEDCRFIDSFVRHSAVGRKASKNFVIHFPNRGLEESVNGVKLLVLVYQRGDKKIIAVGPIFNYSEK